MDRNKQFDEHLDLTDTIHMSGYGLLWEDCTDIAHQIQEQGYRKASEVAEEIFVEIDKLAKEGGVIWTNYASAVLAELKKKYTEGGE